jgi:hypothetical protein
MAKEHRDGKAKVSIFFAQVEGGDGTIQDGLRTLAAALGRVTQPPPVMRQLRALPPAPNKGDEAVQQRTLFDEQEPPTDEQEQFMDEQPDAEDLAAPAVTRQKESRPKKPTSYTLLGDLNLRPADKPSLKDFFAEKKPGDHMAQVAVFLSYLTRTLGVTDVWYNHLYTCFQHVGKKVPLDLPATVRNAAKKRGWIDQSDGKRLRLTTAGENYVDHDLPGTEPGE